MQRKLQGLPRYLSVKSYIEKLLSSKKKDKIKSIVLHGSMARGDYSYSSDIDLLIIVSEESKRLSERIYEYSEYSNGWVEPLVYTDKEIVEMFNDFNPLILYALKDGITLIDDSFWSGLKKKFDEMEKEGKLKRKGNSWIIKVA
ncbi:MAG: nucleotidyltransferase domain-containing protein [Candidatus Bathyarchaeia archaeon]